LIQIFLSVNAWIKLTCILVIILFFFQASQLTHVVEGRFKGIMEEVDKEKALKQVAKATLNEKNP